MHCCFQCGRLSKICFKSCGMFALLNCSLWCRWVCIVVALLRFASFGMPVVFSPVVIVIGSASSGIVVSDFRVCTWKFACEWRLRS